jgi:hypothetical protein
VAALAVPILAVFAAVILLLAVPLAALRQDDVTASGNLCLACLCALVAGLFVVTFHAKRETVAVPVRHPSSFLSQCRAALAELGYDVQAPSKEQLLSRPSFHSLLFGGRMQVVLAGRAARLTGPKLFVELLRGRLRWNSYMAQAEQPFKDDLLRRGERMLKRVHISLRLTSAQWAAVGKEVVEPLAAEGASVVCAVHLMAQGEQGVRESLVDGALASWLEAQGIAAEFQKDHVRWEEPGARPVGDVDDTQLYSATEW